MCAEVGGEGRVERNDPAARMFNEHAAFVSVTAPDHPTSWPASKGRVMGSVTSSEAKEEHTMKRNMRRIVLLGAMLALVGVLVIGSAACAQGPDGGVRTRGQQTVMQQEQVQNQVGTRTQAQLRSADLQWRYRFSACRDAFPVSWGGCTSEGCRYGPGDGTGPIGGGQFGPGPYGKCIDLNGNGICDCRE